ncbi:MAG: TrbI/VirB10 family protein [Candidatus Koribacter versatilis]|uniref:TrbI/VirB10 family protein n=1 Tax=Candidatus Korobacter versatilis TaxID=658062 RepID=A0A932ENY7_9BACT|nr:TrbI/VirB10 family protein [Candidatus Koribacter versatilis]
MRSKALLLLFAVPLAFAQTARTLPAGSGIRATLDTPLSTRTSLPGDRFTATIDDPSLPGARLYGEVAAAAGKTATLDLRFRELILADGMRIPLAARVLSVMDARRPRDAKEKKQKEKDVNLPASSPLTVRLDQPVTLPTNNPR